MPHFRNISRKEVRLSVRRWLSLGSLTESVKWKILGLTCGRNGRNVFPVLRVHIPVSLVWAVETNVSCSVMENEILSL